MLYGAPLAAVPGPPKPIVPNPPLMEKFVGINGFIDNPIGRLAAVGTVREYHSWGWDEGNGDTSYPGYPNNQNKFSPSYVGGWDFDLYYANLFGYGLTGSPCLQASVPWLTSEARQARAARGRSDFAVVVCRSRRPHVSACGAVWSRAAADGLLKLAADSHANPG